MQAARDGFGMQVVCAGRNDDFTITASDADFVSLHLPANAETRHFLNRRRLEALPPHAWVINTARGSVVDEIALYDALAEGRMAGAALDVFEREPYEPADPARDLRNLPNVILTPHIGSNTVDANARMASRALRNVRLAAAGDYRQMDVLNPEVLDKVKPAP
jgi:phosphoglycerate dehydrogenase-like enzyme